MNDTLSFSGIDAGYDAILPVIMRLPDVVATEAEAISEEEHAALLAAVEAAAAHLGRVPRAGGRHPDRPTCCAAWS